MTATTKFLWFCVVVVYLFIAFASPAKAHIVVRDPLQPKPVKAKIKLVKKNLYHARGVIVSVKRQKAISPGEWRMYENHRWLYRRASERLTELRESLLASQRPPHHNEWVCIHGYEGAWNANTGNGYYGGLQMDYTFMRMYGPTLLLTKGTADNWTPLEQMWVAERAWKTRGFYPWPNTARKCGLI